LTLPASTGLHCELLLQRGEDDARGGDRHASPGFHQDLVNPLRSAWVGENLVKVLFELLRIDPQGESGVRLGIEIDDQNPRSIGGETPR
jgi:hypothetical protein